MAEPVGIQRPLVVGRYELHGEIAHGGMATVHVGRILGEAGFSRTVAIKRLHAHCARDPDFSAMFLDEARLASRVHHPNVVSTLDVVAAAGELFVVMEYIQGESLAQLIRSTVAKGGLLPVEVVAAIGIGMLEGLHAAHEATDERGRRLGIVHRDVSPQNVLVGIDGVPRVIDFGVAKAASRLHTTREGQLKGKLGYMAPEQFDGAPADRRGDVYSAAIVLWEALAGRRLFETHTEAEMLRRILHGATEPPSRYARAVPAPFDALIMRALSTRPEQRFATTREMALALERAAAPATARAVGEWVEDVAVDALGTRAKRIVEIESRPATAGGVASITDGDDEDWQRLNERASMSQGATLRLIPRATDQTEGPPAPTLSDVETSIRKTSRASSHAEDDTVAEPPASGSLDRPTPVHPIAPASSSGSGFPPPAPSAPQLASLSSAPPAPAAGPAPMGTAWTETWTSGAWTAMFRPVSPAIVGAFVVLVLLVAVWILVQRDFFGSADLVVLLGFLGGAGAIVYRMAKATEFRLDGRALVLERKPGGTGTEIATDRIKKFLVIDEGPGKDPNVFHVHFMPFEGDSRPLEVEFGTDADARFAAERLNEALARVRAQARASSGALLGA